MNVRGGQLVQSNGNPVFPGTLVTGPFLAGNILRTGGGNLAGLGTQDQNALGNVGYVQMTQIGRITQAASPGQAAGVFVSPDLIIPAQSLIIAIWVIAMVAWGGAANTANIGVAANPTLFTGGFPVPLAGSSLVRIDGPNPGTAQQAAFINVGNQDIQIVFSSTNTGPGVGLGMVEYIQGINAPTT